MKTYTRFAKGFCTLSLLLALSACDLFKKSSEETSPLANEPVIIFNGKTQATGADFDKKLEMLMNMQPGVRDYLNRLPVKDQATIYRNLLQTMADEEMISAYVVAEGLNKGADYEKMAKDAHKEIDRQLQLKAFQDQLQKEIVIADEDAQKFYNENAELKNNPQMIKAPAGVVVEGILCASEQEAQRAATRLAKESAEAVARSMGKKVKSFGLVTMQSVDVDGVVRAKVSSMQVPGAVAAGKWALKGLKKEVAVLKDFADVKDIVKKMMSQGKIMETYNKKMADLKTKYAVEIKEEFINKRFGLEPKVEEVAVKTTEATEPTEEKAPETKTAA
jgi:hypothetical protein